MALILNIETSATVCSVCIARDGHVLASKQSAEPNSHARLLTLLIDELLTSTKISFQQVEAIAISAGPGSYTGLRIGFSIAKGLCYALNKPLIAVPTLQSLAEVINQKALEKVHYMPVLDARRMDVYTAIYDSSGNEVFKTACVTLNEELEKTISSFGEIYIGGNATPKCKGVFTSPNIFFVDNIDCDSVGMVAISENKFQQKDFEDLAYFEPMYLKEFTAKLPSPPLS